jgi:PAS domain S-box-containing protein
MASPTSRRPRKPANAPDQLPQATSPPSPTTASSSSTVNHEQAWRSSEARLAAVLETAVDAIITIDQHGIVQSVNPATERMFGLRAEQIVGRNVSMLMPAPYALEHDGYMERYLRSGERRIIGIGREVAARRGDGSVFPVDLAVSEVQPGKLFTGIGTLAAGLGHDMNNMLLPVRAHLNAAAKLTQDNPSVHEHIRWVHRSVDYLQQLADGLHFLAMDPDSADESGGVTHLPQWWTQTGAVLSKAVPKHVRVIADLPDDLPALAVAPHALTQAALNLIVNAGEAIPAGRKRRQGLVRLGAALTPDRRRVQLSVADNGSGMSDEVKRRAFDIFFTTKPRGLGTGLGLAMVRKVVDRCGGTVTIDSQPGQGTTVTMAFPIVDQQPSARRGIVDLQSSRAASLVTNLLHAGGVEVETLSDDDPINCGASADDRPCSIVVVGPTKQGLMRAQGVRANHPAAAVIVLGQVDSATADAWGLLKPVVVDDVWDVNEIRAALGQAISHQNS